MPVVQAVGIAVGRHGEEKSDLAVKIEKAMRAACEKAQAEGITDPDVIRNLMLDARDKARVG